MHREFVDQKGRRWEVWEVRPGARGEARPVRAELAAGWLAFESEEEKRRLAPIPSGWNELTPEALAELCESAAFVRERGESGHWPRFVG
ncbi:MAG: hypothetical protein ACT4PJ_05240 [Gemmatimonadaceae bacterium]